MLVVQRRASRRDDLVIDAVHEALRVALEPSVVLDVWRVMMNGQSTRLQKAAKAEHLNLLPPLRRQ